MMMTMMSGPPQGTFLGGRTSQPCQDKLEPSAGPVGAVSKVTMISRSDAEHAHDIESKTQQDRLPGNACPESRQAHQMNGKKRDTPQPFDAVVFSTNCGTLVSHRCLHAY